MQASLRTPVLFQETLQLQLATFWVGRWLQCFLNQCFVKWGPAPLIRTEHRRLREFFQNFYPKCNINWGFQLFWSAYKPKTKNNFFGPKSAVQSQFLGKCLGLEKNFISQILFKI